MNSYDEIEMLKRRLARLDSKTEFLSSIFNSLISKVKGIFK